MGCLESRVNQEHTIGIQGFKEIKQFDTEFTNVFGISPNENTLAYPFHYDRLKIVNLQTSLKRKEIKIRKDRKYDREIMNLCYFENSRMVCCVVDSPRIQIYRLDNHYKQLCTIYEKYGQICDLKIINQQYIKYCKNDSGIRVIDFTKKKLILKIPPHKRNSKQNIVFDSKNQVIIHHSYDYIRFYQMNGKNIISYYAKETFEQIQIIDKTNQLISKYETILILWQIDYQQRQLVKLQEYENQEKICQISTFLSQLIILLDGQDIIFLNINDFKTIYRNKHKIKNFQGKQQLQLQQMMQFQQLKQPKIIIYLSCVSVLQQYHFRVE